MPVNGSDAFQSEGKGGKVTKAAEKAQKARAMQGRAQLTRRRRSKRFDFDPRPLLASTHSGPDYSQRRVLCLGPLLHRIVFAALDPAWARPTWLALGSLVSLLLGLRSPP